MADEPVVSVKSRRYWLMLDTLSQASDPMTASEVLLAVDRVILEHPEWDMDQQLTLEEWRQRD